MDRNNRKKIIQVITIFFLIPLLTKCFSISSKKTEPINNETKRIQYESDESQLQIWQSLLDSKEYQKVSDEISLFLKSNPNSQHWYSILFTFGKAKEGLEDWNGAREAYLQIIERSTDKQMEYVALAFYQLAYCYEVLFENEKSLAALNDAAHLQSYLPLEVSLAEIPARIASVHSRLNQSILADTFTHKAEQGINQLRALRKNSDPEWMSRTLVRMGTISLGQIDELNYQPYLFTLMRNQRYLVQAIELNHISWAPEAQKSLLAIYNNLWTFIDKFKVSTTKDLVVDEVNQSKKKADFLSLYLESIENLKSYEAPEESSMFLRTADLYLKIKELESKALSLLNQELLKKPWQQTKRESSSEDSILRPSEAFNNLQVETMERLELHNKPLPKKKK